MSKGGRDRGGVRPWEVTGAECPGPASLWRVCASAEELLQAGHVGVSVINISYHSVRLRTSQSDLCNLQSERPIHEDFSELESNRLRRQPEIRKKIVYIVVSESNDQL